MKKNLFRLEGFEWHQKTEILLVGLVMFGLLFSYPVIRSTTDALFLEHFKARNSPQVWLLSSFALIGAITLLSKLQRFIKIQKLFLALTIFTAVFWPGFLVRLKRRPMIMRSKGV